MADRYPLGVDRFELWSVDPEGEEDVKLLCRGHHDRRAFLAAAVQWIDRGGAPWGDDTPADRRLFTGLLACLGPAAVAHHWYRVTPGRTDDGVRYDHAAGPGPGAFPATVITVDRDEWERWEQTKRASTVGDCVGQLTLAGLSPDSAAAATTLGRGSDG